MAVGPEVAEVAPHGERGPVAPPHHGPHVPVGAQQVEVAEEQGVHRVAHHVVLVRTVQADDRYAALDLQQHRIVVVHFPVPPPPAPLLAPRYVAG